MSDAYDEIHKVEAQPIAVGVDLTAVASAAAAADIAAANTGVAGYGSDLQPEVVSILPSFRLYWDDQDARYRIANPRVIDPDGHEIVVEDPGGITDGSYFLRIDEDDGSYTAEITDSSARTGSTVAVVPLFTLNRDRLTQYHVGVYSMGSKATSLEGDVFGCVEIKGKLNIGGKSGSGLCVDTTTGFDDGYVEVDLVGRGSDSFGIHNINQDGSPVGKVFATADVTIPQEVTPGDGEITITSGIPSGSTAGGSFTVNQQSNKSIYIPSIASGGALLKEDGHGNAGQAVQGTDYSICAWNSQTRKLTVDGTEIPIPVTPSIATTSAVLKGDSHGNAMAATQGTDFSICSVNTTARTITVDGTTVSLGGGISGNVNFVGSIRYDTSTHQLQQRVDTLNLATGAVTTGSWAMITGGQAAAHSGEH